MIPPHQLLGVRMEIDLLVNPTLRWAQAPSQAPDSGSEPRPEGLPWHKPPHQGWQRLLHDIAGEHAGAVALGYAVRRRRLSALYTFTRNRPDEGLFFL